MRIRAERWHERSTWLRAHRRLNLTRSVSDMPQTLGRNVTFGSLRFQLLALARAREARVKNKLPLVLHHGLLQNAGRQWLRHSVRQLRFGVDPTNTCLEIMHSSKHITSSDENLSENQLLIFLMRTSYRAFVSMTRVPGTRLTAFETFRKSMA